MFLYLHKRTLRAFSIILHYCFWFLVIQGRLYDHKHETFCVGLYCLVMLVSCLVDPLNNECVVKPTYDLLRKLPCVLCGFLPKLRRFGLGVTSKRFFMVKSEYLICYDKSVSNRLLQNPSLQLCEYAALANDEDIKRVVCLRECTFFRTSRSSHKYPSSITIEPSGQRRITLFFSSVDIGDMWYSVLIGSRISIHLSDFEIIGDLGKGAYGSVQLVRYIPDGHLYAMKRVIVHGEGDTLLHQFVEERTIMQRLCDSAFIVKLLMAFRESDELFYVLEYCDHGDLRNWLDIRGVLEDEEDLLRLACNMNEAIEEVDSDGNHSSSSSDSSRDSIHIVHGSINEAARDATSGDVVPDSAGGDVERNSDHIAVNHNSVHNTVNHNSSHDTINHNSVHNTVNHNSNHDHFTSHDPAHTPIAAPSNHPLDTRTASRDDAITLQLPTAKSEPFSFFENVPPAPARPTMPNPSLGSPTNSLLCIQSSMALSETHPSLRSVAASLIVAVGELHAQHILHRDIKPENLLLTATAAKLADFGLSKTLPSSRSRAFSFCGTDLYRPPEMTPHSLGYSRALDWWQVGCVLFEMAVGKPPFDGDRASRRNKVLYSEPEYPSTLAPAFVELVKGLLKKDPTERLGAGEDDVEEVKRSVYFDGFDWDGFVKTARREDQRRPRIGIVSPARPAEGRKYNGKPLKEDALLGFEYDVQVVKYLMNLLGDYAVIAGTV